MSVYAGGMEVFWFDLKKEEGDLTTKYTNYTKRRGEEGMQGSFVPDGTSTVLGWEHSDESLGCFRSSFRTWGESLKPAA